MYYMYIHERERVIANRYVHVCSHGVSFLTTFSHLRENMSRGVYVDGLTEQNICSARDAYQVTFQFMHTLVAVVVSI